MKKIFDINCIILLVIILVSCSVKDNNKDDCEGGLLWQISGNGLRDTSYLFGTMHSVEYTFLDSVQGFNRIFQKVKNVSTENDFIKNGVVLSIPQPPLPDYYYLPDDITYKVLYPNNTDYIFVDSVLRKNNRAYFYYKPWFWLYIFTLRDSYRKIDNNKNPGLDLFILSSAYKHDKCICPLEEKKDLDFMQIVDSLLLTKIPLKEQAYELLKYLKSDDKINESVEHIYRTQNLNSIGVFIQKLHDMSEDSVFIDVFNMGAKRNHNWMKKLPEIMKSGSTLIAVGVAHLIGDEGLISLLRNDGYNVEPISENIIK